jgi:Calcineurin-like phosphoesterase
MLFGAVGDLHGDFDAVDRAMSRHPEIAFWLCPGDLAAEDRTYPRPRAPLYWIKGNNEDFDFVAAQPAGSGTIPNLFYIPNGTSVRAFGLAIAGLGGTFAPTWYETPAAELPSHASKVRSGAGQRGPASGAIGAGRGAPATKNDRRRHFVHDEVEACKKLTAVDVFMSHEAPRPYPLGRVNDAGKTPINEVLSAMRPRLHLFGHHHRYTVAERQKVTSIGLELASDSYLIFDGKTLAHQLLKW